MKHQSASAWRCQAVKAKVPLHRGGNAKVSANHRGAEAKVLQTTAVPRRMSRKPPRRHDDGAAYSRGAAAKDPRATAAPMQRFNKPLRAKFFVGHRALFGKPSGVTLHNSENHRGSPRAIPNTFGGHRVQF